MIVIDKPAVPFIRPAERKKVSVKLEEIATWLYSNRKEIDSFPLFTGKAGAALFLFYYHLLTGKKKHYNQAFELLNMALDEMQTCETVISSHCNGMSGVAWCIDMLNDDGIISEKATDIFGENIYTDLSAAAASLLERGNYDYLHGAIGIMLYLNDRNKDIGELTDKLISLGQTPSGLMWRSLHAEEEVRVCYNLSLAHGNPGVLGLLIRVYRKSKDAHLRKAIHDLVSFILKCRFKDSSKKSVFPNYVVLPITDEMKASRIAWCYGDLGIAQTLLEASSTIESEALKEEAAAIFKSCMQRKDKKDSFIADAGFCHGSAGVAHMYNRLFLTTQNEEYLQSASYWFSYTMDLATYSDGLAGFKAFTAEGMRNEPSMLEGIAGIGLSLISAIEPIDPKWDKFFMLS
jgi:lantibiotic biosynthesis protein